MMTENYLYHLMQDDRNRQAFLKLGAYVSQLSSTEAIKFRQQTTKVLAEGEKLWNLRRKKI